MKLWPDKKPPEIMKLGGQDNVPLAPPKPGNHARVEERDGSVSVRATEEPPSSGILLTSLGRLVENMHTLANNQIILQEGQDTAIEQLEKNSGEIQAMKHEFMYRTQLIDLKLDGLYAFLEESLAPISKKQKGEKRGRPKKN